MIPILQNHDNSVPPIGYVTWDNGRLFVDFVKGIEFSLFYEIFGDVGMRPLEVSDGEEQPVIKKAEILEFSLSNGRTGTWTLRSNSTGSGR